MHYHQIIFFFLLLLITESFTWFDQYHEFRTKRSTSDECCVSSKINVASKKANIGREFFRHLSTEADSYKEVNPENMCNLIHFFIQQASLNNKSITFTKGMFVLSDSTNTIFEQLMKAKDEQKSGDDAKYAGYGKRIKHLGYKALQGLFKKPETPSDTFIYVRGDESSHYHGERGSKQDRTQDYPAYGMDIPGACMPSGFGHILFGRLPSIQNQGKYNGERIYIKPEFFGIRHLKQFFKHAESYMESVSRKYVCQLEEMKEKPGCSKEDAFRENTDKKLLEKWHTVLTTIPSISNRQEDFYKNATTYGIGEIYRQVKQFEATNEQDKVKDFLTEMIKQYGTDDISVRKGREIIFTTQGLLNSPLTCEFLSKMKKC
ncbi:unnamed protein product [Adineta steineri]|uniref:Uncharacterized protein n=1 Tax=Adineta steineri TaxID=433720 RepID=A0A818ZT49_9BILA|nr:unnamed protein product [Adineta steineri]